MRLRELRHAAGLTQEQLAARADLTAKYIGQLERNEACPSLRALEKLANGLGIPIPELLRFEQRWPAATLSRDEVAELSALARRLDRLVRRIAGTVREAAHRDDEQG